MSQSTYYVNCPHCARIVEVVCPAIGKEPKRVKADKSYYWMQNESMHNDVDCPGCGQRITLFWYL